MFDENLHSTWKGAIMDKPGNHRTITIKINGKERMIQEERNISHDHKTEGVENISYPDLEALAKKEAAAGQEARDEDDFDWILPEIEEEDLKEYKIVSTVKNAKGKQTFNSPAKKLKDKSPIPSILLIVFLAVLFGSSLGVFLLKMVISDPAIETSQSPPTENTSDEKTTATGNLSVELPSIPVYLVQGGAFSNVEAANVEASTMVEKGLPAKTIEMEDKAYLFVGLANNLENAKAIGTEVKNNGTETFAKELAFGGKTVAELKESEQKLLEIAPELYQIISEASSLASLSKSLPAELQTSFEEQTKQWNTIGKIEAESIQKLRTELDKAISNLNNYLEGQDKNQLIHVQQHLLNFLALYHTL